MFIAVVLILSKLMEVYLMKDISKESLKEVLLEDTKNLENDKIEITKLINIFKNKRSLQANKRLKVELKVTENLLSKKYTRLNELNN